MALLCASSYLLAGSQLVLLQTGPDAESGGGKVVAASEQLLT